MSLEVSVICDGCGVLMAASRTADKARQDALAAFGGRMAVPRPGGRPGDFCAQCVPGVAISPAWRAT